MATHNEPDQHGADEQPNEKCSPESSGHPSKSHELIQGEGCKSVATMMAVLLPCWDSKFDPGRIDQYERLQGAEITVHSNGFPAFSATTDAGGTAMCELPKGASAADLKCHKCEITPVPPGYDVEYHTRVNAMNGQLEVCVACKPKTAVIEAFVYAILERHRPAGKTCKSQQQVGISGVCITVKESNGKTNFYTTDHCGMASLLIKCPGTVEMSIPPTASYCGGELRADYTRLTALAAPGETCGRAEFPYGPVGGTIEVEACLCNPGESAVAFPEQVTMKLQPVSTTGEGFERTAIAQAGQPARFDDLDSGTYCVTCAPSVGGFELTDSDRQGTIVQLREGQVLKTSLSFQQAWPITRIQVLDQNGSSGLADFRVTLKLEDDTVHELMTDSDGIAEWRLEPDQTVVASIKQQNHHGTSMVPVGPASHEFTVSRTKPNFFEFRATDNEFCIIGTVYQADGMTPIPFAQVQIWNPDLEPLDRTTADGDGNYAYEVSGPGKYYVSPLFENGHASQRRPVLVQSCCRADIVVGSLRTPPPPPPPPPPHNGKLSQAVEQLAAFPILSESVGYAPVTAAVPGGPGTGGRLGLMVQGALRDVLAWRPRESDHKGFLAALKTAFTSEEVEGHKQFRWTPRSYAVTTDLGSAITGAQASIYTRAKAALDDALPLLDGLYPLRNEPDEEEKEASRSIVRGEFIELVNELGQEGGPRVERVDAEFQLLLGVDVDAPAPRPEEVKGALGRLRAEFGFDDDDVNTVEEERNLTNYFVVVEYITSLRESWLQRREAFKRGFLFDGKGEKVFLGTQLVHISRALGVVAESVQELLQALNSVFLGPAERQTTELRFRDNYAPLFISELLDWVERFASNDGPRLVQDGGKLGVAAFYPTIEKLVTLVGQARIRSVDNPNGNDGNQEPTEVPASYASARAQRALQELYEQLNNLEEFARPFKSKRAKR